jgi:cyclopropane-fatty-acyl-phospholipid synthase
MSLTERIIAAGERVPLPDLLYRAAIAAFVARTDARLSRYDRQAEEDFAADMARFPIAIHVDEANAQHYELPAEFFAHVLGPQRKYSSCLYQRPDATLAEAEERALSETIRHADLADGQRILELGCGWGALSLRMAERFPGATITAVSNSRSQRAFIEAEAHRRGLNNLAVVTADMNLFAPTGRFDRVVSVEMFEHMANWRALLARVRSWLVADGRLFLHVFTHISASYRFNHADRSDWIAQHFFTGGIMPGQSLAHAFPDLFAVDAEWRWSGEHYRRTADDWLANFDSNRDAIDPILMRVYGRDAALWRRRWRLFFLATAGLFGHDGGRRWGVGHFRMRPT